jgi:hypothetical protein
MSGKISKSFLTVASAVSLVLLGAPVHASAAAVAPAATEPPPTPPNVGNTTCSISLLGIVSGVDPCKIIASLQEVAAYGLEDLGVNALQGALSGVNLTNVCLRGSHPKPPPASLVNACPVFGG